MFKLFLLISALSWVTIYAQIDTLDTVYLNNGEIVKGKVLLLKQDVVEFVEHSTNIKYEYNKTNINHITLQNGKTITFNNDIEDLPKFLLIS